MSEQDDFFIEAGSANVFADLGFPDAEGHQLKAQLVAQIAGVMGERKMTQVATAKATGQSQPAISRMLKGQFRDVSVERLMKILTKLDCEVDIVVRPKGKAAHSETIHVSELMPA